MKWPLLISIAIRIYFFFKRIKIFLICFENSKANPFKYNIWTFYFRNVKEYLLNSNTTLEFDVIVSNFGEDSFETTFVMTYPTNGIFYKRSEIKIPGLICTESTNKTVVCDIGNPLPSGKIVSFLYFFIYFL